MFMILTKSDLVTISSIKILGFLTACFYISFTLVPDSHSVIVLFPFVSLWQVGLLFPVLWLLLLFWQGKVRVLGNGLDWLVGLLVLGIASGTVLAEFPQPAIWNSWIVLCWLSAVYVLNSVLTTAETRYQVLVKQGYLNLAFIVISLWLWTTQTLLPELDRIASLKQQGINLSFNFSVLELRNWAPIGHQNYVAGYLLLAIPLLIGLSILAKGWQRWLWIFAVALGLLDLYTTSSRGGWLGAIASLIVAWGLLLFFRSISRLWLILLTLVIFISLGIILLTNNRFYSLIQAAIAGQGVGELAYRTINALLGWRMGMSQPLTGVGLGGVPLLYQKYRPLWAGRESELAFQLHSTPFHLWAEMGIWAIVLGIGAIAFLLFSVIKLLRNSVSTTDNILCWCICFGLFGYGVMSLTDYQLDNVCISGTLALFLVCLTAGNADGQSAYPTAVLSATFNNSDSNNSDSNNSDSLERKQKQQKKLGLVGWGITIAFVLWLMPVHFAWQLSSQGFQALANQDTATFVSKLTAANKLAPSEPYYPYQLAWNLGDMSREHKNRNQQQQLSEASINWFKKAIAVSPYREFGHSNLGWLLLNSDPVAATKSFANSAQLVPAKRGVFYGLGWGLLGQRKVDLAIEAFTLEALRDPLFITSPIWRSPILQPLYPRFTANLTAKYDQLLQQHPQNSYFHLCRGSLNWWLGNLEAVKQDWTVNNNAQQNILNTLNILMSIGSKSALKTQFDNLSSPSAVKSLLGAWFDPEQRSELLAKAWLQQNQTEIEPQILEQLAITMNKSPNFEQWLKYNSPVFPYRQQRAGFGVVNRHIDGAIPADYFLVIENTAIATWFPELFFSPQYNPNLDKMLQPQRDKLLAQI